MGLYVAGNTYAKVYVAGQESAAGEFAGDAFLAPSAGAYHSFVLSAITINAVAMGRFGGLTETFTLGGATYTITSCFTHNNGIQFRFQTNAQALAFIAAGFTVDSGITGQSSFSTSLMENINGGNQQAAQYRSFPGRFTGGQDYTITISE